MENPDDRSHLSLVDLKTLERLQSDATMWELSDIAEQLGLTLVTAERWRHKALKYIRANKPVPWASDLLPKPDEHFSRKPLWKAGTIRRWAMQTGRMRWDGTVVPARPQGRPRQQPVEEPIAQGA